MKSIITQAVIERNSKGQFTGDPRPSKRTGKYIPCMNCGEIRYKILAKLKKGEGKFCSSKCYWEWMKGKPNGLKGTKMSEQARKNLSEAKKGKYTDEKSPSWKGDKVGYGALHDWVRRRMGNASYCQMKNTDCKGRFEWANKSQEYKRDLTDWMPLCHFHHGVYDFGLRSFDKKCEVCGIVFKAHLYRKGQIKYCSRKCKYEAQKGKVPWNKKERVIKVCKYCKKEFSISQRRAELGYGIYCSHTCKGKGNYLTNTAFIESRTNWLATRKKDNSFI